MAMRRKRKTAETSDTTYKMMPVIISRMMRVLSNLTGESMHQIWLHRVGPILKKWLAVEGLDVTKWYDVPINAKYGEQKHEGETEVRAAEQPGADSPA